MAEEELTADEVLAFAATFQGTAARALLERAQFPGWAVPESGYANPLEFWTVIAREVARGVMPDGRARLIAAAHQQFPYNPAFASAPRAAGAGGSAASGSSAPGVSADGASGVQVGSGNIQVNNYYSSGGGQAQAPPRSDS